MQNNKLFNILTYLDRPEIVRCRKYINSPYFNNSDSISELFEIVLQLVEKKSENLPKEKIWKKIFGTEKYDDVRFRKLCSDLLKVIEGFLAQQIYEENPIRQATHLIEAVARKKMSKLYNTAMKTARRLSERQLYLPATHYFYEYQIEKNYYNILTHQEKRISKTNVESIVDNLDRFYLAEKLRYYCSVLSRQYEVSHEYKVLFIEEIIKHLNTYTYNDIPSIKVYYQIYLTQTESENPKHFDKLKKVLKECINSFPKTEAYEIYTYAINYCTRRINLNIEGAGKEFFETYLDVLDQDIIEFDDEDHGPFHFKNIILVALRLGEYDWTEKFIKNYQDKLPESLRDNAVSFNMAQLHFYKKEYGKVIRFLHQVEYEDLTYNLNSKVILLCTYYELDEIEPLYSLTDSFRVYLQRNNKISTNRSRNYLNFLKFIKKLSKIMPGDKSEVAKFVEELNEAKGVVSLDWLKRKALELE